MKRAALSMAFLPLWLAGCANTAEYLRSQPVTHFPAAKTMTIPGELEGLVTLHCMKDQAVDYTENGVSSKECLYISADASNLTRSLSVKDADTDKEKEKKKELEKEKVVVRDKAITFLLSISDLNCSNFLQRAFANKAGLDFTRSFMSDMATGASAGTAFSNPTASAALSISNLVVGKGVESFNTVYYFDKTFQALEAAILAERMRVRTYILAKQAEPKPAAGQVPYDLLQALSDVRRYDDACSIKAGLAQLVRLADNQKSQDEATKISVELDEKPREKALQLMVPALKKAAQ